MFDSWLLKRFPVDVSDYLTEYCTRAVQLFSTCIAYGVFAWRYHNVPQNWEFVGTSLMVAFLTLTSHVTFLGICAYRVLLFLTLEVGAGSSKGQGVGANEQSKSR
jgi:hypothetical protein